MKAACYIEWSKTNQESLFKSAIQRFGYIFIFTLFSVVSGIPLIFATSLLFISLNHSVTMLTQTLHRMMDGELVNKYVMYQNVLNVTRPDKYISLEFRLSILQTRLLIYWLARKKVSVGANALKVVVGMSEPWVVHALSVRTASARGLLLYKPFKNKRSLNWVTCQLSCGHVDNYSILQTRRVLYWLKTDLNYLNGVKLGTFAYIVNGNVNQTFRSVGGLVVISMQIWKRVLIN